MAEAPVIVWFRRDLRLSDNPALNRAAESGKPVIALYIMESGLERPLGGASRWWLHHSLTDLSKRLSRLECPLIVRAGRADDEIETLIGETGADHIVWNRRYAKDGRDRDARIKSRLKSKNITAESFRANLLSEPWEIETKSGSGYYKVFTPYWRAARQAFDIADPIKAPARLRSYGQSCAGGAALSTESIQSLGLLPSAPDWAAKMAPHWTVGERGAHAALSAFLDGPVNEYPEERNRPDHRGTSRLSAHLAFGEISPRQIWHHCKANAQAAQKFLSEIGWREFSYVLLFHNPDLATQNFKADFDAFEWTNNPKALRAWQRGQTGYPFVDAGMRELWQTGWQHNRVRMVTASFLIKHLLIDWREGEQWFHDTLVDFDPASNAAGWQWVAGSGADASPYFRIFNPFTQGEKFDPNGDYVRRYIPELARLPNKYIHRPWDAPKDILKAAGVVLGHSYPAPIVDHKSAREKALSAYKRTRG